MIEIEINDKSYTANTGEMVIAIADKQNIAIPRFCYHKNLSIAANCRMCLIEIEGMPKAQPACATPVADGMKIYTKSNKAKLAQKAIMDFLLINHPLDCPICDQGGECELQDVSMAYGNDSSVFNENKRVMPDKDIGPLVQTEMTRCIHCTRCIRFGQEVGGMTEMGATGRGEALTIETFLKSELESELSGNMIDICPVGALTSKPFRYQIRSWQLASAPVIARHDNIGSFLWAQTYDNSVKRVSARENDNLNETWISDRDRFSYQGLEHKNRLLAPKIKIEQEWKTVSWQVALDFAIKGISKSISNYKAKQFGVLASPNATLEEFYLLNKLARAIGTPHIDYRIHQKDFSNFSYCASTIDFLELESSNFTLIIGGNTRFEQPMLNHRIRKSSLAGCNIVTLNFANFNFNFDISSAILTSPRKITTKLMAVLKALLLALKMNISDNLADIKITTDAKNIAKSLLNNKNSAIVLGEHLSLIEDYSLCIQIIKNIASISNTGIINASMRANSLSANIANIMPDKDKGYGVKAMFDNQLKAYLLLDIYPEYDLAYPEEAYSAFKNASFVLALNSFNSNIVDEYANVVLPINSHFETTGSHINLLGNKELSKASILAPKDVKPAWKIIKVLADLLELNNFKYTDIKSVSDELEYLLNSPTEGHTAIENLAKSNTLSDGIDELWTINPYKYDALLRHCDSLGQTTIANNNYALLNTKTAKKLAKKAKEIYKQDIVVVIDNSMDDDFVFIQYNNARITIEAS